MKKKLFACLLAVLLLFAFCSCSVTPSPTVTIAPGTSSDTVPTTTEETLPWYPLGPVSYKNPMSIPEPVTDFKFTKQVMPEVVENTDDLPVLKWVCTVNNSAQVWNEAAVVELNQMLEDRNLPYRVQFTVLSVGGHRWPWDWFGHPEVRKELENADLIYGFYSATEMEQWLLPITDHVYGNAQPALSDALPDPLCWFSKEANGELYGIPNQIPVACASGWRVKSGFMEKFHLTVEDFQKSFWEMDELFAKIYEMNDNQPFIFDDFSGQCGGTIAPDAVQAVVPMSVAFENSMYQDKCLFFSIDLQAEKPTVVNMLETEMFAKTQAAVLRYLKAGYMDYECTEIKYTANHYSPDPYLDAVQSYYTIPCGPLGLQNLNYSYMTGISVKSAHSEEALSLLEQIITDKALRLQLCYGKEGRDYTLEDGVYSLITQEDGSCYYMDFLSPQAIFFEFTSADVETGALVSSTSDNLIVKREGMTRLESYKKDITQASFSNCPVTFDYSDIDAELTAIGVVMGDYYPMFTDVEHYSQEYYEEMHQLLEEAGMETVINELQRQLDVWIAEHPDWDPFGEN